MKSIFSTKILLIIFFVSGFTGLVYQVAWHRILTLYYSVENISTTLIVSVYMLGLGLGSILGGHFSDKIKNKILFYVYIELLIGIFGFISIPFLEFLGRNTAGSNSTASFVYIFSFLCFPTILMGVTLPLLTKLFNDIKDDFAHNLSLLYFINTLGASLGALVTSYLLISFFGLDISIYLASSINIIIAISLYKFKYKFSNKKKSFGTVMSLKYLTINLFIDNKIIFTMVFVTGFIAISYEIIWIRIISTIVKASPYAFSSILFIYLLGIAFGSFIMNKYLSINNKINSKNLFFAFQFFIALYTLGSIGVYYNLIENVEMFFKINYYSFSQIKHPSLINISFDSYYVFFRAIFHLFDVFFWPLIFIFIPTLFMGASFPLIASIAYKRGQEGMTVGIVYFFNILGNVTGGLATGLLLLGTLGTEYSLLILSLLGLLFLFFINIRSIEYRNKVIIFILIIGLTINFFPRKNQLYEAIHGKGIIETQGETYISEGVDAVIYTYSNGDSLITYINGMTHGGRPNSIFQYEVIETLSHKKDVKNVLIIGFGTGSTTETVLKLSPKPQITLVELNKTLIQNLSQVDTLNSLLVDENINLIYADARKYLYNNEEKFDAIFIDPLRSTTSFSNNLYSKQFFELINNRLNPGGVFMIWIDEYQIIPKTLSSVFSYINQYSVFCVTSNQELKKNLLYKNELFANYPTHREKLLMIDRNEPNPIQKSKILEMNAKYPINEDLKPRSEYYIGLHFLKD